MGNDGLQLSTKVCLFNDPSQLAFDRRILEIPVLPLLNIYPWNFVTSASIFQQRRHNTPALISLSKWLADLLHKWPDR